MHHFGLSVNLMFIQQEMFRLNRSDEDVSVTT